MEKDTNVLSQQRVNILICEKTLYELCVNWRPSDQIVSRNLAQIRDARQTIKLIKLKGFFNVVSNAVQALLRQNVITMIRPRVNNSREGTIITYTRIYLCYLVSVHPKGHYIDILEAVQKQLVRFISNNYSSVSEMLILRLSRKKEMNRN